MPTSTDATNEVVNEYSSRKRKVRVNAPSIDMIDITFRGAKNYRIPFQVATKPILSVSKFMKINHVRVRIDCTPMKSNATVV